jgi:L-ascorbate metabolism protein UlaG (beta-lactamase superfamily)
MPAPVTPEAPPRPDIVLVTHAHTDHTDPDTLGVLHRRFPDFPFVVPAARVDMARSRIGEGPGSSRPTRIRRPSRRRA